MVMLSRRVPPRAALALEHEARARGTTVGQLIDRLCERAGFYTTPTEIPISARPAPPAEVEPHTHEYAVNTTLPFDTCIHCPERRYH